VLSVPSLAKLLPAGTQLGFGFTDRELWFAYHLPAVQLLTFVFGMFLAKVVLTGRRLPLKLGGAVALTVGAYLVTPLFGPLQQFSAVMVVPLGLLIAAGATADLDRLPTFLGSRPMVWLGDISFAFYMWQYPVLVTGHHWLGAGENWSTATALAVTALVFAVTLVLSWATFKFVEQPVMRRFAASRRRLGKDVVTPLTPGEQIERAA
jgi:peptidoglycan/LPS O-acetylase OafA/YrhL